MGNLTFRGGVHPFEGKALSENAPLTEYLPKGELAFLINQHIGKPAIPVVEKGNHVLAGQLIARADGFVSANIVSSVSGTVKDIRKIATATGAKAVAIIIENDGEYQLAEGIGEKVDTAKLSNKEILDKIAAAGIVGLGGAGFPTHVKLMPKNPDDIKYVIVNGAECEPYITCDDQLMRTYPDEIVMGLQLMVGLFPNAVGVIIIEDNKPAAIEAIKAACVGTNVRVMTAKTKYPQGGERSIVSAVTGKHLRLGLLPADFGCVVDNVTTVRAIYRAVAYNEPLMERNFTVSGDGIEHPSNFIVKIGTSQQELIDAAGGFKNGIHPEKIISGGPMMGFAMPDANVPVCKANNALTILAKDEVAIAQEQMTECLRCGRCADVCPEGLIPQQMAQAALRGNLDRYENKLKGLECVACGSCTFICPAKRPLMQLFKQTKAEIMAAKRK
ncbi:MAG: electron transport complex subunit RsxC [Firmicutes bacterium]|nr:electron transport complex subunit RsxC [Bacillota bacterium]